MCIYALHLHGHVIHVMDINKLVVPRLLGLYLSYLPLPLPAMLLGQLSWQHYSSNSPSQVQYSQNFAYHSQIMPDALVLLLFPKLCLHISPNPSLGLLKIIFYIKLSTSYAQIMPSTPIMLKLLYPTPLLCSKLCWHNLPKLTQNSVVAVYIVFIVGNCSLQSSYLKLQLYLPQTWRGPLKVTQTV